MGLLLYANTLKGPFVLDDLVNIVDNHAIRDLSGYTQFSGTRYMAYLTFALNYAVGGLNPFDYHLVNTLLHITNAALVYLLVTQLYEMAGGASASSYTRGFPARQAALAASVVFLAHPLQTQAVSYITQRFTSLAVLFYLGSLVSYLKARSSRCECTWTNFFYLLALLPAVLAAKTKEISFTLPFMIALFELTLVRGGGGAGGKARKINAGARLSALIPFFLTLMIIPLELFVLSDGGGGGGSAEIIRRMQMADIGEISPYRYFITQLTVIVTYLGLFFHPRGLHFDYNYPLYQSITDPTVLASGALLLALAGSGVYMLVRSLRRGPPELLVASLGILWFFLTLSVESSFVPISDVIFEHRFYLPGIGLILTVITGCLYLLSRIKGYYAEILKYMLFFIVVVVLAISTYSRNSVWSDEMRLYVDEVDKNPASASSHNYLGIAYLGRGAEEKALYEFRTAAALGPGLAVARKNLGLMLAKRGDLSGAMLEFKALVNLEPAYAGGHYNLGLILLRIGDIDRAEQELMKAARLSPNNPDIRDAILYLNSLRKPQPS